jgi:hypothetical protein
MVYIGGRYDYEGRYRRTEEEVMTMDVDNALKHSQAGAEDTKPKRTTRSGAKAKAVEACPNPTHDGLETMLPNGDPVVPPGKGKGKKKARITSKAYVEVSGDKAAPASPPVVPAKTRVKSRATKKAVVAPSDDEDEFIELPRVLGWSANENENNKTPPTTPMMVPPLSTNPNGPVQPPVRRASPMLMP